MKKSCSTWRNFHFSQEKFAIPFSMRTRLSLSFVLPLIESDSGARLFPSNVRNELRQYSLQSDKDVRLSRGRNFVRFDAVSSAADLPSSCLASQPASSQRGLCLNPFTMDDCRVFAFCRLHWNHDGFYGNVRRANV